MGVCTLLGQRFLGITEDHRISYQDSSRLPVIRFLLAACVCFPYSSLSFGRVWLLLI